MTAKLELNVNGIRHTVHVAPDLPLLWVIRDYLGYTGCALHIDGAAVHSSETPVFAAVGKIITTIEAAAH